MSSFAGSITALFVAGMVGGYAGLCLLGPTDETQTMVVAAAPIPDPPAPPPPPASRQTVPSAGPSTAEMDAVGTMNSQLPVATFPEWSVPWNRIL